VSDTREAFGWACSLFYQNPSHSMLMVGVTGTSGKTTTTYMIESILRRAGHRVGVVGTVSFRIGEEVLPSTHTTPATDDLQRLLSKMKEKGCSAVVMEVSSHALKQNRPRGIAFDAMVFTNLSREHLDYHSDMEDYFESKKRLFTDYVEDSVAVGKKPRVIVNCGDPFGRRILSETENRGLAESWSFSISGDYPARVRAGDLSLTTEGTTAAVLIEGVESKISLQTSLLARFNVENSLAAMSTGFSLGLDKPTVELGISDLQGVPGRLERVPNAIGLHVLVDYAHKPDALEKVLQTLQELRRPGQKILTVVGCGGDRDRTKRPLMGRLAAELSDLALITSDNPRTESPRSILEEILGGIPDRSRVLVREDRREAIFEAVQLARPGDLVLIAGKGHEDYQIIGDPSMPGGVRKIHFDDREVAAEACRGGRKS
ncbi:UDP-N-acetylmuramoyl-L-alanyl-D-glutamate--2,6-diaminopimelate ligase, partial [bacterium]|nr:UDP-N-acetylmuramoyl-L-alanyl-D-glutamate--2,6-diaminopimelate ligase [bacterium]